SNALFDVLSFPHVSYLFFFLGAMLVAARGRSPDAPSVPARARTHRRLQPRAPVRVLEHATSSGVRQLDRPGATVSR
ncbi:MAG: hypothetical protein ACXVSE_18900, partial [Solirubrobacteraceae bacterium]